MADAPLSFARRNWELLNEIVIKDTTYSSYDADKQQEVRASKPWSNHHEYFKEVTISAVALLKMAIHARSGMKNEVMGLMTGKIVDDKFVIMDAFPLPVEGTETRVNASEDALLYTVDFLDVSRELGREENPVGWYHSHPGYGCWLSGIDVATQKLQQQGQDPFVAVVIDPNRTCGTGKIDIGAFRTYPDGVKKTRKTFGVDFIPDGKARDFDSTYNQYYEIPIEIYKTVNDTRLLESLWADYWITSLSSSPLLMDRSATEQQIASTVKTMSSSKGVEGGKHALESRQRRELVSKVTQGVALQAIKRSVFDFYQDSCLMRSDGDASDFDAAG
eukprot:GHVN01094304.1.p1 GENE.GHVN01094304.1~~GHVN01094304.1.p1  ORF type:complete len:376 (+),score=73.80 GHVN01094304.1:134-1129(+)